MKALALVSAVALAGCAMAVPPPLATGGTSYRALGTEPFWSVTIEQGEMTYQPMEGPPVSVAVPAARTSFNGHRYETPGLTLDITHVRCSDGMSDRVYPDKVMVMVDGQTLSGCGGEIVPPANLANTSWSIVAIDGEPIAPSADYYLNFANEELTGKAGCNGFSGPFILGGDTLTPGPIVATRMACPPPRMEHERKMLAALGEPVTVRFESGERLVLAGSGATVTLRRAI